MRKAMCAGAAVLAALPLAVRAQPADLRARVERYVEGHQRAIVGELVALLAVPNMAADRENIRRNATLLQAMLVGRGFRAETLETAGNPLVYGELRAPGATRTLLLYAHYDGQPVNPAQWKQASPFRPILRDGRMEDGAREVPGLGALDRFEPDWRLYARSASDDKSPIVAMLAALDALAAEGLAPTSNLRVVLDGEEEDGSASLNAAIERHRDKLAADALLVFDGPVHPSGKPTLVFGARGILTFDLTVYGPKFALHSGHYGNWAPNPAMRLAQLLATFKDDKGQVLVAGFYDGIAPPSPEEQKMLAAVPDQPEPLRRLFGISAADNPELTLQEALQLPSFNVRGLSSAYVGDGARTIIPEEATAAIDVRLVKETPAADTVERVRAHLRRQGYHVVSEPPDDATRARYARIVRMTVHGGGTEAFRTSPLLPVSRRIGDAVAAVLGEAPVRIRTSGGTVPIAPFIAALGCPAVIVPVVNFDNNQHGENENLRLGQFFQGIVTMAALLQM